MTRRRAGWWTVLLGGCGVCAGALLAPAGPAPEPRDFGPRSDGAAVERRAGTTAEQRPGTAPEERAERRPVRLVLPRLGVRATVVPVGVTDGGDLAVPGDARRVGWYRFGGVPAPDGGSTVLVGHVDSRSRGLGALAALRSVRRGDRVGIRLSGGDREHYRVTARRSVAKERFPARVFRRSGPSALTLVTCTGPFLPERGGYQRILLVTAVPAAAP